MRESTRDERQRTGSRAARWNARYRAAPEEGLFGAEPSAWLRMALEWAGEDPPDALLPADGDGRNGRWLTRRGVAVTAFDLSPEATARAGRLDRAAGVAPERAVADLERWRPPANRRWRMAVLMHLHGPPPLRKGALAACAAALAPGGLLVVEGFSRRQADCAIGPDDPELLWSPAELADAPGLAPEELLEGVVRLEEGARHRGKAAVVRLIARRIA